MVKQLCCLVLWLSTLPAAAEDWHVGVGVGIFDVDRKQAGPIEPATHFDSSTANIFIGFNFNKYLGLELQFEAIARGFETDVDGFRSEFGGYAVSPALIVKYPLGDDQLDVFVRAGATYLDYTMSNLSLGRKVDDTSVQTMFGAGLQWKHVVVEYVNYDKLNSMYLEQLRVGFRFSF